MSKRRVVESEAGGRDGVHLARPHTYMHTYISLNRSDTQMHNCPQVFQMLFGVASERH